MLWLAIALACSGDKDGDDTAPAADDSAAQDTAPQEGTLALRFAMDADYIAAMDEEPAGRFWATIWKGEEVDNLGPMEGAEGLENVYVEQIDLPVDGSATAVLTTTGPLLGEVVVSGVPLPEGATNFEDKIALLAVNLPDSVLQPGGLLDVTLTWQALVPLAEDYTVFVQVLDANDQLVGQIDSWPVQGTFPTSQWTPGEIVEDRHQVQLASEMPPGQYRVQVGFYLLQTLRRLSVLDGTGTAVDDKLLLTGFMVE